MMIKHFLGALLAGMLALSPAAHAVTPKPGEPYTPTLNAAVATLQAQIANSLQLDGAGTISPALVLSPTMGQATPEAALNSYRIEINTQPGHHQDIATCNGTLNATQGSTTMTNSCLNLSSADVGKHIWVGLAGTQSATGFYIPPAVVSPGSGYDYNFPSCVIGGSLGAGSGATCKAAMAPDTMALLTGGYGCSPANSSNVSFYVTGSGQEPTFVQATTVNGQVTAINSITPGTFINSPGGTVLLVNTGCVVPPTATISAFHVDHIVDGPAGNSLYPLTGVTTTLSGGDAPATPAMLGTTTPYFPPQGLSATVQAGSSGHTLITDVASGATVVNGSGDIQLGHHDDGAFSSALSVQQMLATAGIFGCIHWTGPIWLSQPQPQMTWPVCIKGDGPRMKSAIIVDPSWTSASPLLSVVSNNRSINSAYSSTTVDYTHQGNGAVIENITFIGNRGVPGPQDMIGFIGTNDFASIGENEFYAIAGTPYAMGAQGGSTPSVGQFTESKIGFFQARKTGWPGHPAGINFGSKGGDGSNEINLDGMAVFNPFWVGFSAYVNPQQGSTINAQNYWNNIRIEKPLRIDGSSLANFDEMDLGDTVDTGYIAYNYFAGLKLVGGARDYSALAINCLPDSSNQPYHIVVTGGQIETNQGTGLNLMCGRSNMFHFEGGMQDAGFDVHYGIQATGTANVVYTDATKDSTGGVPGHQYSFDSQQAENSFQSPMLCSGNPSKFGFNAGVCQAQGNMQVGGFLIPGVYNITSLPACSSAYRDDYAQVNDATSPTYLGTYVGGGAVRTLVSCAAGNVWVTH